MNLLSALRYLVALSEHRHFGRAAAACHITQPALSNALRALEAEFGVSIVQRGRNFVGFTPEGERVLVSARMLLRERELLREDLRRRSEAPHGALVIGAVPSAIPVAARFAALLQRRHVGITTTVRALSSSELERGLEELALDLVLGYTDRLRPQVVRSGSPGQGGTRPRSGRAVLPQYNERYYLVSRAPRTSAVGLQIGDPMTWTEAAGHPLCLLTPEMHHRAIVDSALAEAGVPVTPVMQTNSTVALVLAVVEGQVSSVLPGAVLSTVRSERALQARPLIDPAIETPVGFMTVDAAHRSRAVEAALAFAKDPDWLSYLEQHSGLLTARVSTPDRLDGSDLCVFDSSIE
ncbi:MAG: hypothetical protein RL322_2742 [Pseudomonadota bacterium]|jgi:DNA-binding transcriptional LysR family regulator